MPRHFQEAIDELARLPPFTPDEHDPPVPPALRDYARSWALYHPLGLELPAIELADVAAVWKKRVDLRGLFAGLVLTYPCPQLLRPLRRTLAAADRPADLAAWLRAFPDLAGELRTAYAQRAGRFREPQIAVPSALIWARHLGGGEEAYRAAAHAIRHDDRRQIRRGEGDVSLDVEDHSGDYADEVAAVRRHLQDMGAGPLELEGLGRWWPTPAAVHAPAQLGALLARAASASHAYAGPRWGAADEALYAGRLARMDPTARGGFITHASGPTGPLVRIAALGIAGAHV